MPHRSAVLSWFLSKSFVYWACVGIFAHADICNQTGHTIVCE
jgi:hypothetical protein